ncbi:PhzF family phenazine biosynthesis protein [Streptomyces sp. NPDC002446]
MVCDSRAFPDEGSRQALARELGLSETVFVDDAGRSFVDIYTPELRIPFAGYPLVGVAWLLGLVRLELPVGSIPVGRAGGFTWINARADGFRRAHCDSTAARSPRSMTVPTPRDRDGHKIRRAGPGRLFRITLTGVR